MSSFGRVFRVTTFGESHAKAIGAIVEGVPSLMKLSEEDIQPQMDRRKPGQSSVTTSRGESDKVQILSGIEGGLTLGTPIGIMVANQDVRKTDYDNMKSIPRPGHADYTYYAKYGVKAESGGGRSSARETAARVAAGAIADKILLERTGCEVVSYVSSVGSITIPIEVTQSLTINPPSRADVDKIGTFIRYERKATNITEEKPSEAEKKETYFIDELDNNVYSQEGELVFENKTRDLNTAVEKFAGIEAKERIMIRCPHRDTALKILILILQTKAENDSIGGTIATVCKNVPVGLGEPCFDKLEATLAHAMLSIPATKGFEIGSGFEGTKMKGSKHNDAFTYVAEESKASDKPKAIKLGLKTNNAGGTLGGISSGANIYFRVAFKPVSTISLDQETVDIEGKATILEAKGRHDACVLPRAPAIVEAMASIVLVDAYLLQLMNMNRPSFM